MTFRSKYISPFPKKLVSFLINLCIILLIFNLCINVIINLINVYFLNQFIRMQYVPENEVRIVYLCVKAVNIKITIRYLRRQSCCTWISASRPRTCIKQSIPRQVKKFSASRVHWQYSLYFSCPACLELTLCFEYLPCFWIIWLLLPLKRFSVSKWIASVLALRFDCGFSSRLIAYVLSISS